MCHTDFFVLLFLPACFFRTAEYYFIGGGYIVAVDQFVCYKPVGNCARFVFTWEIPETHGIHTVILAEIKSLDTFGLESGSKPFGVFDISKSTHLNGVTQTGDAGGFCGRCLPGEEEA